jgi:hypothetical protein
VNCARREHPHPPEVCITFDSVEILQVFEIYFLHQKGLTLCNISSKFIK